MEMYIHEKEENIINLINEFLENNSIMEYETSLQKCQAHYPVNKLIENYLKEKGYNYNLYGKETNNGRFSTTQMEILDENKNFTGVNINYKKTLLNKYLDDRRMEHCKYKMKITLNHESLRLC
jgi:hypothetical protein